MSKGNNPAIIHLRDFSEELTPDPTRPEQPACLQLKITLNVPHLLPEELSDDYVICPIPTIVRFFTPPARSHLYRQDVFVYVWGSFSMRHNVDSRPQLIVNAHSVSWWVLDFHSCLYLLLPMMYPLRVPSLTNPSHPGDYTDPEAYAMHCPEAAHPTITLMGTVIRSGGQLNEGQTLLHYDLRTTVYDSSVKTQATFMVRIYFKNGKRWANFSSITTQSRVIVAGHVCGLTVEEPHLAVQVDDIYFVPGGPPSMLATPQTPQSAAGTKRPVRDRWGRRAGVGSSVSVEQSTPSKRPRRLQDDQDDIDRQLLTATSATSPPTESALPSDDERDRDTDMGTVAPYERTSRIVVSERSSPLLQDQPAHLRPRRTRKRPAHYTAE